MPVSGNDAIFSVQKNRVVLQLCGVAMELSKKIFYSHHLDAFSAVVTGNEQNEGN